MKRETYMHGHKGHKYRIWDNKLKKYVHGISEETPMLAEARLFQMIGDRARQWRYKVKQV